MSLTDTFVRQVKPIEKQKKYTDGDGLYLLVYPNGAKGWRFKYMWEKKEQLLSLGTYPEISLKEARERRDEGRSLVAKGINPSAHRKAVQATNAENAANSFEVIAREWFAKHSVGLVPTYTITIMLRLENDVLPYIGKTPISLIGPKDLLKLLKLVEDRGAIETAHRILQYLKQIFRYAIITERIDRNPAADLNGALKTSPVNHLATITDPQAIGALMRAIDGYGGSHVVRCALKLAPLTFVRPGELRHAEWSEFDFDGSEWRIPAEKMKAKQIHRVPLSRQAIEVLEEIRPKTGALKYVFPNERTTQRPMSNIATLTALRRMGYEKGEMTAHGFRSMASTSLNESGLWHRDAIERQLAHGERNAVRAAYNYAEYWPERVRMMQWWADHLDELRAGRTLKLVHGG